MNKKTVFVEVKGDMHTQQAFKISRNCSGQNVGKRYHPISKNSTRTECFHNTLRLLILAANPIDLYWIDLCCSSDNRLSKHHTHILNICDSDLYVLIHNLAQLIRH